MRSETHSTPIRQDHASYIGGLLLLQGWYRRWRRQRLITSYLSPEGHETVELDDSLSNAFALGIVENDGPFLGVPWYCAGAFLNVPWREAVIYERFLMLVLCEPGIPLSVSFLLTTDEPEALKHFTRYPWLHLRQLNTSRPALAISYEDLSSASGQVTLNHSAGDTTWLRHLKLLLSH